ncbi:MAG: M20 family metallopeptidase [Halobacteriales archaeon]|nr:M20 family metallopeptidase [Halobacteriales archaeon]
MSHVEVTESALVDLTADIIGYDTSNPPGNEAALASFLTERLAESAVTFDIDRYEVMDGRPNVVATAGDPTRGSLLLTGHMDVVPATATDWMGDPFELRRDGDRIVGRGTSDMKAALAAKLIAAEAYLTQTEDPGEVILAFTVDEERGGGGTKALVDRGLETDAAIIGEPTELQAAIAQYGSMGYRMTVRGRSAHSGRPDKGINAINGMARAVMRLEELQARERDRTHPLLDPGPSVSVTEIEGGIAPNVVPDAVEATINWRLLPTDDRTPEEYDAVLREALDGIEVNGDPVPIDIDRRGHFSGVEVDPDEAIVESILAAGADVGVETAAVGFNAGSDTRYLIPNGIPAVLFGPGSIEEDAHTVDESIRVDDLVATARVYKRTCERFLG